MNRVSRGRTAAGLGVAFSLCLSGCAHNRPKASEVGPLATSSYLLRIVLERLDTCLDEAGIRDLNGVIANGEVRVDELSMEIRNITFPKQISITKEISACVEIAKTVKGPVLAKLIYSPARSFVYSFEATLGPYPKGKIWLPGTKYSREL